MAPKIIDPDLIVLKDRQKSLQKHYEKLNSIKHSDSKKPQQKTVSPKPKNPIPSERNQEISRTNKLLLQKITSISHRKLDLPVPQLKGVKSLNRQLRQEKAQKINEENEHLAARLRNQKPLILKSQQDKAFQDHRKYKVQVSKERLLKYQNTYRAKSPQFEKPKSPNFIEAQFNNTNNRTKSSTQRVIITTPLPPPAPYKNPEEYSCTLLSDSSYSDDFD